MRKEVEDKAAADTNRLAEVAQLQKHLKQESLIFESKQKSVEVYNFANSIVLGGYAAQGVEVEKSDRGQLPHMWGGRRITICTDEVAKATSLLAAASSGDMLQDRHVKVTSTFRTNSLNSDAEKRDHDDFMDCAMGAYLACYEATGTILVTSERSVTRAAAIVICILLLSSSQSKKMTAQEAIYRVCGCLSDAADLSGLSVYFSAFIALQERLYDFEQTRHIRNANIDLDTAPRPADVERDGDTQEDPFEDMFDFGPRSITREGGERDTYISDTGIHDVIVWEKPATAGKTRSGKKRAAPPAGGKPKPKAKKPKAKKPKPTTATSIRRQLDQMEPGAKITRCFRIGKGTANDHLSWEEATFVRVQVGRHTSLYIKANDLVFKYGDMEWGHSRVSLTSKTSDGGRLLFEAKVQEGWFWGHCALELEGSVEL